MAGTRFNHHKPYLDVARYVPTRRLEIATTKDVARNIPTRRLEIATTVVSISVSSVPHLCVSVVKQQKKEIYYIIGGISNEKIQKINDETGSKYGENTPLSAPLYRGEYVAEDSDPTTTADITQHEFIRSRDTRVTVYPD